MSYEVFSEFYDSLMDNAEYDRRADYYEDILKSAGRAGGILLDLGCGTGNMSFRMADKGFDVIGTDSSVEMLSIAREKMYENGKTDILFLNQPMEDLDLYGTVDNAICVLDCINHLDGVKNIKDAFARVSLFMVPGGVFAFDVNTIYKHQKVLADNDYIIENDDVFCAWQNKILPDGKTVQISLDFFIEDDGIYYRESESFCERAYSLSDISAWLDEAGFDVKNIYDDLTFSPVTETSERAVFMAVKR